MDKPFETDGCSGGMDVFWRFAFGHPPPWEGCCVDHDLLYWVGGQAEARRIADQKLMICVAERGHPHWAYAMYIAVRIGGSPWFPFRWRWGYGWHLLRSPPDNKENPRV